MNVLYRFLLIAILFHPLMAQQTYFPPVVGTQWDTLSLSSLGWNPSAVAPLYSFLDSSHTRAFILLKDGKIVLEKYFGTFTKDSNWYWASAGKTMTSVLIGIARSEGSLQLTDTSSKYLGKGWTSEPPEKEQQITILNQLTMTTGLDDNVVDKDCTLPSCLLYKADVGTRWAYHNAPYTLLDSVIQRSTGESLNLFYITRIRSKIGMNGAYFRSGDYNNVLFTTPRSMARFGLLMLNRGVWASTAVLNDSSYFTAMTQSSQNINPSYGYLWWLNGKSSYMLPGTQLVFPGYLSPSAPKDMFAALGKNGQLINVVPSLGLVFIRMGDAPDNSLVPMSFNDRIWQRLNAVISPAAHAAERSGETVVGFSLSQNYPNPFNPSTTISFSIPADSHVSIRFFNALGQQVDEILSREMNAGEHSIRWDASRFTGGVYYYRIRTGSFSQTKKLLLLK
ncbi:MAG: serine hydrolase [Bacteroidota bacterium]